MTGMWLNIALIAVIFHQCFCVDIDCNNMFPEPPYGHLECCQEETESPNVGGICDIDTANIKWSVTNTTSGRLSVEFDLMPQSCGSALYELKLFVNESVTNAEECEENTSFTLLHSSRIVEILTDNAKCNRKVSPCGKTAVATFNYVFSGCYSLCIEEEPSYLDYFSKQPMFIETEYKKDLLVAKKPRIITRGNPALQELQFSVGYVTRINVTGMELRIRKCESLSCTCGHGITQHYWEMALSTSGQFMCKMGNRMSNKPSCHVVRDAIECTIHNITAGFYCVMVEIADDRCEIQTVWNNDSSCTYNSEIFEVEPALPPDVGTLPLEPSPAASDAILVAIVLAVVMVCLCALVLICRRWRRPFLVSGGSSYVTELALPHRPRILLLYPRDCEPFMNMMATFRQVLKEVTACQVYDCFDPVVSEELCQNKTDWLLTYICSPDVKVVLVESKCAVLQQMALMQHMKVIYKDPTWLDDLFLYGLRVLLEDLQTNVYERVFVVRIHNFTEENDNLCHITPYTRYVVPQNTEKLLSCLYQESALEHVLILKEDSDNSLQILQDNIRMLQVFKQQNGDYLNKLFETVVEEYV